MILHKKKIDIKVLIVDDSPENIKVLGNILKLEGYSVLVALNGEQAIQTAISSSPDLVLLDIMMPEMDGYEVCEKLKQNQKTSNIPVVFLTAASESENIVKGFKIGAVDYITKPFSRSELVARVNNHIELKLSKEEIVEYAEKMKIMNSEKDKFFSIIAHDLKSPFNGFLGMLKILHNDFDLFEKEEIKEYVKDIYNTSNQVYKLLENLLEWSRLQRGVLKFVPVETSILMLVNNVINLKSGNATLKNIKLTVDIDEKLTAYTDGSALNTVLRNLISNAIKFTYENGEIIVSASEIEIDNKSQILIKVKDDGQGISSEDLDKLFRIDINYTTIGTSGEKGTGLGLILCKEMVEKQGGKIWVESTINEGTTFFFTVQKFKK